MNRTACKRPHGNFLRQWLTAPLTLGFWLLASSPAFSSVCEVNVTTTNFGTYVPTSSTPVDTTGIVTISCTGTGNVRYTVSLNPGTHGSLALRKMANGASRLNYNLYLDAARTRIWGDGTGGTAILSDSYQAPGSGATVRTYPVYGRIPALQGGASGGYLDLVTITVDH